MATDRLYYRDSYLREFTATVVSARAVGDHTEVVLDRTAFHPEGGGQPADLGTLSGVPLLGVVERGDDVVHLVRGVVARGEVRGQVDWERRFDFMQQHSGQHILSQAFERLLGARTLSFRMGAESCGIDLGISALDAGQVESVEALANRVVFENRPILLHLVGPSDLSRFTLRHGTERTGEIRVVEMGDFDTIPCGGTHCRSTAEVGLVKVVRWERRGGNVRADFLCGGRALRDYQAKNEAVAGLAAAFSVPEQGVRAAVERLLREAEEARRQADHLRDRLLDYRAAELGREAVPVGRAAVIATVLADCAPEELRHLAARLTASPSRVALLVASDDRAHVVFARSADLSFDAAALFRQVCGPLGGRGGGRPSMAQGGIPDPDRARRVLEEALRELPSLLAV